MRAAWHRVRIIAIGTVLEGLRQRVFALLLVAAMGIALGALALRDFNLGASELKFVADLGFGALSLGGSLLAIAGTVQTVFAETEQRTIQLLFARPVRVWEFVAGKWLGLQCLLGLFCLLVAAVVAPVLWARAGVLLPAGVEAGGAGHLSFVALGGAVLAQWAKCGVLTAALLLLCGVARSRLLAMGAGLMLLMIFHAHAVLAGLGRRPGGGIGAGAAAVLAQVLPDFQRFDLSATIWTGASEAAGWTVLAHGGVFIVGYAALATLVWRGREY